MCTKIIYFRYHYPQKWLNTQEIDTYILKTLIAGAFSGNPDNLIDKCTRKIKETEEFDFRQIFNVIRAEGRNLEIAEDNILRQRYTSKSIHLLFSFWCKDFNYHPAFEGNLPQIDHIFRSLYCGK